jgi:tRNA U34 5-methylaminomethyl-2-thiouridine-forming methyltransferase MnmC
VSAPGYSLVTLANGVRSVRSHAEAETFHPVIGPAAEAEALYVRQLRLRERLAEHSGEFVVWDVGLGAAANVLTVLRATRDLPCRLRLISFDHTLEPLRFALRHGEELGYFGGHEELVTALLAKGKAEQTMGSQHVSWQVYVGDFPSWLRTGEREASAIYQAPTGGPAVPAPHAILFDAFSPAKNPEMWTLPLFTQLFRRLDPARPCAMPTYSRATLLRVTWLLAGFHVGVGHATGEKEETTLAANTLALLDEPLDRKWLERARRSTSAEPLHEPKYRQAPLTAETWERLRAHPQFV